MNASVNKTMYFSKNPANAEAINTAFIHLRGKNYSALNEMHTLGTLPRDFFIHHSVKFRANTNEKNNDAGHVLEMMKIVNANESEIYHHTKQIVNHFIETGQYDKANQYCQVMLNFIEGDENRVPIELHNETLYIRDKIESLLTLQGKKEHALDQVADNTLIDRGFNMTNFKSLQQTFGITNQELVSHLLKRGEKEIPGKNYHIAKHFNSMAEQISVIMNVPGFDEKISLQANRIHQLDLSSNFSC